MFSLNFNKKKINALKEFNKNRETYVNETYNKLSMDQQKNITPEQLRLATSYLLSEKAYLEKKNNSLWSDFKMFVTRYWFDEKLYPLVRIGSCIGGGYGLYKLIKKWWVGSHVYNDLIEDLIKEPKQ